MAPIPSQFEATKRAVTSMRKRELETSSLVGIVITFTILTVIVLCIIAYMIRRLWVYLSRRRINKSSKASSTADGERRDSNWARKDSNVLWSVFIDDDDLRKQFARPSKCSRMFSIGSISTLGPLDKVADTEDKLATNEHENVRNRVGHEYETTPTKTIPRRGTAPNLQHRSNGSVEEQVKRVQFNTPPALQELLNSPFLGRQASVA